MELKKKLLERDRVLSLISEDGKFRVAAIRNKNVTKTAQQRHKLTSIPAVYLAKQLTAASLMAVFLKGEERITLEAVGNGPISLIYAQAIQVGEVRGFIDYEPDLENKSYSKLSDFLGEGIYRVTRVLYDKNEPLTGVIELSEGDISNDLTNYLLQSEQIPSIVILDVDIDNDGIITYSTGLILQVLPGVTTEEFLNIYNQIKKVKSLNDIFYNYDSLEESLTKILPFPFKVIKHDIIDFFCRCSKNNFIEKLITLDYKEIKEMQAEGHNELVCNYCNEHYYLNDEDFTKILTIIMSKNN